MYENNNNGNRNQGNQGNGGTAPIADGSMGSRQDVVTSKSLGISNKKPDLTGHILSPQKLSEDVIIMLIKLGVQRDAIHSVKITKGKDGLEITGRVEEYAITEKGMKQVNSWVGVNERASKLRIRSEIYNGLRNKAFAGNLHYQREKIKGDNYIVLNFDAEVLISFLYDIPYDNEYLKVSPIEYDVDKKRRKKLGYTPCGAIVTWKIPTDNEPKGFYPKQVQDMNE